MIVRYPDMSAGLTYYTQEKEQEGYQTASMFSIPFSLDDKDAESVLEDLGEYDPYKWNLYKYDETTAYYRSYVDSTELFTFLPGQAFWLVTPTAKSFHIGPGVTVPSDWSYVIPMSPGWNMIGTPYNQKTVWNSASELVNTLYCWNGVDYDTCNSMQPWRGYWIHNPSTVPEMLYVSPSTVQITKPNSIHRQNISQNMHTGDWSLRVSVEAGGVKDLMNYAGVRKDALEGRDLYDRVEPPPPMGKYLSLFFDHRDWENYQGIYSVDVRNPGQEGYVWPMSITTPMLEETIQVHWTFDQSLPQDWGAYLFDSYEGFSQNLLQGKSITYKTGKVKPDRRVFKLVIGTKNFIENEREGISLEPHEFTLFQNYPNPFNPTTDIRYTLPRRSDVELAVFNTIGQQVRVLIKENQKAGVHQVVWDGKDYNGRAVSSGLYFCRLIASEKIATRKMIVLK
jgi:hypothetical protein